MDQLPVRPIIVGIDGSKHAIRAAIWAVDEAISRDAQLLLVSVIDPDSRDLDREYAFARHALHKAWTAVEATGKPAKLESNVVEGDPVAELVKVSRIAEMVCVGSRGTNDSAHQDRGSTAAALAKSAYSPVAIIQRRHTRQAAVAGQWVLAALESTTGSHAVMQAAFDEAVLRKAPILALTPWSTTDDPHAAHHESVRETIDRYRAEADDDVDVQISTLPIADHITNLLEQSADIDQLIIIGPDHPDFVTEVTAPTMRKTLRHTDCSILILRNRSGDVRDERASLNA
jgi:nucleotide-binding universal stress UspA family protein